jgi:hypothetical protein
MANEPGTFLTLEQLFILMLADIRDARSDDHNLYREIILAMGFKV